VTLQLSAVHFEQRRLVRLKSPAPFFDGDGSLERLAWHVEKVREPSRVFGWIKHPWASGYGASPVTHAVAPEDVQEDAQLLLDECRADPASRVVRYTAAATDVATGETFEGPVLPVIKGRRYRLVVGDFHGLMPEPAKGFRPPRSVPLGEHSWTCSDGRRLRVTIGCRSTEDEFGDLLSELIAFATATKAASALVLPEAHP